MAVLAFVAFVAMVAVFVAVVRAFAPQRRNRFTNQGAELAARRRKWRREMNQ